jgi:hypothetical protein
VFEWRFFVGFWSLYRFFVFHKAQINVYGISFFVCTIREVAVVNKAFSFFLYV